MPSPLDMPTTAAPRQVTPPWGSFSAAGVLAPRMASLRLRALLSVEVARLRAFPTVTVVVDHRGCDAVAYAASTTGERGAGLELGTPSRPVDPREEFRFITDAVVAAAGKGGGPVNLYAPGIDTTKVLSSVFNRSNRTVHLVHLDPNPAVTAELRRSAAQPTSGVIESLHPDLSVPGAVRAARHAAHMERHQRVDVAYRVRQGLPRRKTQVVYTDGSIDTMQLGASALTAEGDVAVLSGDTLDVGGYISTAPEVLGAILALTMFAPSTFDLVIRTDSKFTVALARGGGYPETMERFRAPLTYALQRARSSGCRVRIEWVRGHAGEWGNEMADHLAKEARRTRACGSPLGSVLRTQLHRAPAALSA